MTVQQKNVHLDTTVVADYLFKGKAKRAAIRATLAQYSRSTTSRYVKAEFKKGVLRRLVYLHNKCWQVQSISQILDATNKLPPPQDRLIRSNIQHLANFFSESSTMLNQDAGLAHRVSLDEYLLIMARSYFANLIESSWENFDSVSDEVIDPQVCFPDMVAPRLKGSLFVNDPSRCNQSTIKCGCRKFYTERAVELEKVLAELTSLSSPDAETQARIHSIREILRKPRRLDEKDCWKCGDATIALEAPPESDIFNNNAKHFDPICSALNKRSVGY